MATLDHDTLKKSRKKKLIGYAVAMILLLLASPLIAELITGFLEGTIKNFGHFDFDFNYWACIQLLFTEKIRRILLLGFWILTTGFYILSCNMVQPQIVNTKTMKVANGIAIPVPVGNGQYGTARFMNETEKDKIFETFEYKGDGKIEGLSSSVGAIIDFEKEGNKEIIRYSTKPIHSIILGATRAGKTRRLFLTSIWMNLLAGVNMCVTDCKGEIWAFTNKFAKKLGYNVITFDLRNPESSMCHNFLVEVIDYLKKGNVTEAVDKTWDLVSVLVGEAKGEKIWNDGECATIAAAILIVAQDAPELCKNLTNVYYFIAYMCEADEMGNMKINEYIDNLPDNHPAKGAFQVAKIAPYRTRSSFFTSALATLRHFTNHNIADMTKKSEYLMSEVDNQKTIVYLSVPDEKSTMYGIGSLYIKQLYVSLVEQASKKGGKLDHKFIFKCDEFGNFPVIPDMGTMMSAGAGRNVFFDLVLQSYQQLEKTYKEDYENIRNNAELTIYLRSTHNKTLKEISDSMGPYTVQVNSSSTSQNDGRNQNVNYGSSANMTGRPLLFPNEIKRIDTPDALVLFAGHHPLMANLPDLCSYYANKEYGLGDEEFNKKVFMREYAERTVREIKEPILWGIWDEEQVPQEEKVSFL